MTDDDTTRQAVADAMIIGAAINFADVCRNALRHEARQFTCPEADAIATLLDAVGHDGDQFLRAHAEGDQEIEGDQHVHLKEGAST